MLDKFPNRRYKRNQNNAYNHQGKIVFDNGDIAEEIASQSETANPGNTSKRAEGQEHTIAHRAYACHERGKSTNDRQEARKDDGLATVRGKKLLGLFNMLELEEA